MAGKLATKNGKNICFFLTYNFWRAGGGKIGGQTENIQLFFIYYICGRAGGGKNCGKRRKDLSRHRVFLERVQEKKPVEISVLNSLPKM